MTVELLIAYALCSSSTTISILFSRTISLSSMVNHSSSAVAKPPGSSLDCTHKDWSSPSMCCSVGCKSVLETVSSKDWSVVLLNKVQRSLIADEVHCWWYLPVFWWSWAVCSGGRISALSQQLAKVARVRESHAWCASVPASRRLGG